MTYINNIAALSDIFLIGLKKCGLGAWDYQTVYRAGCLLTFNPAMGFIN